MQSNVHGCYSECHSWRFVALLVAVDPGHCTFPSTNGPPTVQQQYCKSSTVRCHVSDSLWSSSGVPALCPWFWPNPHTTAPPSPPTLYQGTSTLSCCRQGGGSHDHTRSPSCSAAKVWRPLGWKAMALIPVASTGVCSTRFMFSRSHTCTQSVGVCSVGGGGFRCWVTAASPCTCHGFFKT